MEKRIYNWNTETKVETREDGSKVIMGTGIVFNVDSHNLGGFIERIDPGAMDGVDLTDVSSFFNHDQNLVLGRTPNTMRLKVGDTAVEYEVDAPNSASREVEPIERGDVRGSSFMFTVKEDKWLERDNDVPLRTITQFGRVVEMGPVVFPAYPQTDTSVAKRSMDEWIKSQEPETTPKRNIRERILKGRKVIN